MVGGGGQGGSSEDQGGAGADVRFLSFGENKEWPMKAVCKDARGQMTLAA